MRARELDVALVLAAAAIIACGVTMVYSAAGSGLWRHQAVVAIVALAAALAVAYLPPTAFYEIAYPVYAAGLVSLLLVLVWGSGEPARWLALGPVRMQPSEFAKIGVVLALARFFADRSAEQAGRPRAIAQALLLPVLPMLLVRHQPDLGTAVSYGAAFVPMLYWAGVRPLHIFFLLAPALSVFFSFEPLWQDRAPVIFALFILASSVVIQVRLVRLWITFAMLFVNLTAGLATALWTNLLHDYQKARILTFLDPESDPLGAGWNIIQSKIAIGSGGPRAGGSCRARRPTTSSCRWPTRTSSSPSSARSSVSSAAPPSSSSSSSSSAAACTSPPWPTAGSPACWRWAWPRCSPSTSSSTWA